MDADCFGGHIGWRQMGMQGCSGWMEEYLYLCQTRIISPTQLEVSGLEYDVGSVVHNLDIKIIKAGWSENDHRWSCSNPTSRIFGLMRKVR
jgi:hypothetical protein